ncbi:quinone-dependent dihydroorotate dehydrogenase [Bifidobacterium sp. 82T24]|uniref:quinone-dependent dihydroorotate dehydrogenase n=1 Tax=Bifidobacterium pluvialisilvae TaxID=2834436 RepID=UPI001C59F1B7|nr:quinone-dependent dihydroorotate dehydrogenase [Bifidobacterium pluvialisilvae]MBW3087617.1 quinone-dependent dihydroorotate dehydrogenase [Bifidobacterium pluvialisilvae]
MSYVSQSPVQNAINKASTDLFTFAYRNVAKKAFFAMPPDKAHDTMIAGCAAAGHVPPLMWLLREMLDYTDPALETEVMGIRFHNPFGLSAGLDKDCQLPTVLDAAGFGFETVGSTTARPCAGNPRPWFHRLPDYGSMVVHAGLANDGSEKVIARAEKAYTTAKTMRMSVSIARTNDDLVGDLDEGIADYRTSFERAVGRTNMIEVNVSCPNTKAGEPFTDDPNNLDRLFAELDKVDRPQPVLVKLPLNKQWPEFKELLDVLADHNVQGVSIANLQKDRTGMDDVPADWQGGLSGLPCRKRSDAMVAQTYREYGDRFAIAGIGGVFTPRQAYLKIRAGASLVMFISSLMYCGPQNITTLKRGLVELLHEDGFDNVAEAVGVDVQ